MGNMVLIEIHFVLKLLCVSLEPKHFELYHLIKQRARKIYNINHIPTYKNNRLICVV